ncbi:LysR substrate-binding domain-containing protein [Cupriavidus sp. 30B13]|uniref:LysR substrate-binding domain-containing protein n=1 Tax=Cupriavidus sp. 30B13 TaxID=3384241 RepID=UPI003B91FD15
MTDTQTPRGRLRIGLPLVSAQFLPALTAFQARHPDIELDIDCDNRKVDVVGEGYDAVVRTGDVGDERLAARELGSFRLFIVGSPAYLARHGRPAHPRDLAAHAIVQYRMPHSGMLQQWPLELGPGEAPPPLPVRLTTNSNEARLHFALEGLGLTCMSEFSVRDALDAGKLEAVLEPYTRQRHVFRLLWPAERPVTSALQAFIDFVGAAMTAPAQPRQGG